MIVPTGGFFISERALSDYPRDVEAGLALPATAAVVGATEASTGKSFALATSADFDAAFGVIVSQTINLIVEAEQSPDAILLADDSAQFAIAGGMIGTAGVGGDLSASLATEAAFAALTSMSGAATLSFAASASASAAGILIARSAVAVITSAAVDNSGNLTAASAATLAAVVDVDFAAGKVISELIELGVAGDIDPASVGELRSAIGLTAAAEVAALGLAILSNELSASASASTDPAATTIAGLLASLAADANLGVASAITLPTAIALDVLAELASAASVRPARIEGVAACGRGYLPSPISNPSLAIGSANPIARRAAATREALLSSFGINTAADPTAESLATGVARPASQPMPIGSVDFATAVQPRLGATTEARLTAGGATGENIAAGSTTGDVIKCH